MHSDRVSDDEKKKLYEASLVLCACAWFVVEVREHVVFITENVLSLVFKSVKLFETLSNAQDSTDTVVCVHV